MLPLGEKKHQKNKYTANQNTLKNKTHEKHINDIHTLKHNTQYRVQYITPQCFNNLTGTTTFT